MHFLPETNDVFIIHEENWTPCSCTLMHATQVQALSLLVYHMEFPDHVLHESYPICHLEELNTVSALLPPGLLDFEANLYIFSVTMPQLSWFSKLAGTLFF